MHLDDLQEKILDQRDAIKGLLARAKFDKNIVNTRVDDGDRAGFNYINFVDFQGLQFVTKTVNFAISKDSDFVLRRLNMFLLAKNNDLANALEDNVFVYQFYPFSIEDNISSFDGNFRISESVDIGGGQKVNREYQNTPIPIYSTYSAGMQQQTGSNTRSHISGMVFDEGWYLPAGSTLQLNITPILSSNETREYRVVVVLQGFKKVRAFK